MAAEKRGLVPVPTLSLRINEADRPPRRERGGYLDQDNRIRRSGAELGERAPAGLALDAKATMLETDGPTTPSRMVRLRFAPSPRASLERGSGGVDLPRAGSR
jgi:hypothetical protein